MAKLTVKDLNVRGKRVFMRVDYNVPMEEKDGQMVINDATRIEETLPTLKLLIQQGAKIILAAHLGRPKGKREPSMSLRPVAAKLADMLGRPVAFVDDCIGEKVEKTVGILQPGDVLLLENVRYYNEEEANDPAFARKAGQGRGYLCERRLRRGASRACLDGRRGPRHCQTRRPMRGRLADGARIEISRRRIGKSGAAVRGDSRRRESFRQDQGHRPSAGKGGHHPDRRRDGLHVPAGARP